MKMCVCSLILFVCLPDNYLTLLLDPALSFVYPPASFHFNQRSIFFQLKYRDGDFLTTMINQMYL